MYVSLVENLGKALAHSALPSNRDGSGSVGDWDKSRDSCIVVDMTARSRKRMEVIGGGMGFEITVRYCIVL